MHHQRPNHNRAGRHHWPESIIEAGAVVTSDIPDRKVAIGVPARVVKDVSQEQLLESLQLTTLISQNAA
jgi:serine acetyltransferase